MKSILKQLVEAGNTAFGKIKIVGIKKIMPTNYFGSSQLYNTGLPNIPDPDFVVAAKITTNINGVILDNPINVHLVYSKDDNLIEVITNGISRTCLFRMLNSLSVCEL